MEKDCELYFQHSAGTSIQLTDGKVSQASTSLDLGMGVRVIQGDQVGYSYSEDLSPAALLNAARIASQIANAGQSMTVQSPNVHTTPNYYPVETAWDSVNMLTRGTTPSKMGTNGF